ncbi:MAG: ZIP family metal transporter, partial [Candidatus Zixiibacteriota bacterium]
MNFPGWLTDMHPVTQAFLATCFTWMMTAAGAAVVFPARQLSRKTLDAMLGFAAGVMIAASCWSLLIPSIDMAAEWSIPAWIPATVGFLVGAAFLRLVDRILPHLHAGMATQEAEGMKTKWQRTT